MLAPTVRPIVSEDLDWLVDVTRARREALVPHAPRFWHPAADATEKHRAFLAHLVQTPSVLTVRTDAAYLIAFERGATWIVDDAAVTGGGTWAVDGVRLLRHAQETSGPLRLVVPVAEHERHAAAEAVGLRAVEHWWHRDLPTLLAASPASGAGPALAVAGAVGRLVPAPPVYDPGGPVLLVTEASSTAALAAIEATAAGRGARVAVVSQHPDDTALRNLLNAAGYVLTTAFCEAPR
ncbi:hypothetical protein BH11ACT8_BH11ACT8_04920 [soil metagenome]